jgi:hypothetical protein
MAKVEIRSTRTNRNVFMLSIMRQLRAVRKYAGGWTCHHKILGCLIAASLGIILIDTLVLRYGIYYNDNIIILYPVAIHSFTDSFRVFVRPFEYLIILGANTIYLPLWLGVTFLCTIGSAILAALACETISDRQLPKAGWWALGVANPLLFYPLSQPIVSQALSNLLFAACILAFACELNQKRDYPLRGWRADRVAIFLNLMAAALLFTKETAAAAAVVIPATAAFLRIKARRTSPLYLLSLVLPIGAVTCWILIKIFVKLEFPFAMVPTLGEGRYEFKLNPILWVENLIITLSFPITPLPSSFLGFKLLRPLWSAIALASVTLFVASILRTLPQRPRIILPLLVILMSCTPMILVRPSELYSSMIAPFAVSMVFLYGFSKLRYLSLAYALLLYGASLGNGIIFCLGPDFDLFGLERLPYSIYSKDYQIDPLCRIGTTAHVTWDKTQASNLQGNNLPDLRGRIVCVSR